MADCADVVLGYLDRSNFLAGCDGHDTGGAPGAVSFLKAASSSCTRVKTHNFGWAAAVPGSVTFLKAPLWVRGKVGQLQRVLGS